MGLPGALIPDGTKNMDGSPKGLPEGQARSRFTWECGGVVISTQSMTVSSSPVIDGLHPQRTPWGGGAEGATEKGRLEPMLPVIFGIPTGTNVTLANVDMVCGWG
jgi:hypothetical protein